jgi:hypothetical protein
MFSFSIEHAITDFATWKTAFDRFADARKQAGVVADRIRRPVDDRQYLVVELDFETKDSTEGRRCEKVREAELKALIVEVPTPSRGTECY